MKKIVLAVMLCLLLCSCTSSSKGSAKYERAYCPICDSVVDYEPDPAYILEYLQKGYFKEREYCFYYSWDECIQDVCQYIVYDEPLILDESILWHPEVLRYLRSIGWTIIPPK